MKRLILFVAAAGFVFCGLTGCDKMNFLKPKKAEVVKESPAAAPAVAVKGPVVAKVNNMPIGLEDLNQEVESYNSMVPEENPEMKIVTREKKLSYLKDEMVRRMLLYQAALDRGLDRNEDVVDALAKTKMDLLVVSLVKQEADKINVTSKDIEDYYNTYKDQLKEPEEVSIREIVLAGEPEAKDVLVQLLQGGDFATLARERSKGKTANNGGDLGFVALDGIFKEMANVAATLDAGQISSVFKGPEGYYIIKVEAKRGGKQKTLNEMWDDIKRGLTFLKQQQQVEDLIGKLSRQAKIEVYEGEIK
ncbi:MAG: peptidyl-prolyl cis-trans isomerase [Candidatus Omnitrophota bacterium]